MIRVEFTEREARAIANVVDLMRIALDGKLAPDAAEGNLGTGHAKLIAAIERQEVEAV